MMQIYDVVIIGGGIIGSAIAYFLKASPHFQGDVVVIERDPSYAKASTPRSLGGVRQQFSIRENIEIGLFGVDFVKRASQYLGVDNDPIELGWRELGYLFLASPEGQRILAENQQLQSQCGAKIEILNPENLKIKFPWLNTDGIALGSFGYEGEGWLDPSLLLGAFRAKARALGATFLYNEVTCLLYTSPSPRDLSTSRMPSSA